MTNQSQSSSTSPWTDASNWSSSGAEDVSIDSNKQREPKNSAQHGFVIFNDLSTKREKRVYPPSKNLLLLKNLQERIKSGVVPPAQDELPMSEVDAKIAAAEARTDTKFAQVMGELATMRADFNGKFDTLGARLDHVEKSTSGIRLNIWLAAATAVGLVVGIFSWGTSMFGVGMDAQSVADQSAKNVVEQAKPQFDAINARYDRLEQQMGVILTAIEAQKRADPTPLTPAPKQ